MTNKNPTAWEYDHDKERASMVACVWRYKLVETIRENDFRTKIYDDPENPKVRP